MKWRYLTKTGISPTVLRRRTGCDVCQHDRCDGGVCHSTRWIGWLQDDRWDCSEQMLPKRSPAHEAGLVICTCNPLIHQGAWYTLPLHIHADRREVRSSDESLICICILSWIIEKPEYRSWLKMCTLSKYFCNIWYLYRKNEQPCLAIKFHYRRVLFSIQQAEQGWSELVTGFQYLEYRQKYRSSDRD
jgi:hypothetical protein